MSELDAETFWKALSGRLGDALANRLADIVCKLVKEAVELGELEKYQYLGHGGRLMTGTRFPPRWIQRLSTAIEKGAFANLSDDRIVEVMLIGPR